MKFVIFIFSFIFQLGHATNSAIVVVETTKGNFEIELNSEKAPVTVANFLNYVDSKFYDGTLVHRVVKNFVIQGGGLSPDMVEKETNLPIVNEATNGLSNVKGTIGMARTNEIHSATSQFFINTKDNLKLDYSGPDHYGYAVFGKVIDGYEIVEAIEQVSVQTVGEYENVPVDPVVVLSIKRKE